MKSTQTISNLPTHLFVGTSAKIPSNEKEDSSASSFGGVFQLAKDIGVVLLSFMLNIAEEDYYNPTPLTTGADRKDTEENKFNLVSPAIGVVKSHRNYLIYHVLTLIIKEEDLSI